MLRMAMLISIVIMTGCADVQSLTRSADGHDSYRIECSGKLVSMDVCYKKADSLCPKGYEVLDREIGTFNPYPMNSALGMATSLASAVPGVVKGINIQCK